MSEVWQYAIPVTIAAAGYFHYLMSLTFKSDIGGDGDEKELPLRLSLLGFGFLLILDSVFAIHQIAQDPVNPSAVATRVAFLICLGSAGFTFLYVFVRGIQETATIGRKSGKKWLR